MSRCGPCQPHDVFSPAVLRPVLTTSPIPLNCPSGVLIFISEQKQEISQCVKRGDNGMACLSLEPRPDLQFWVSSVFSLINRANGFWVKHNLCLLGNTSEQRALGRAGSCEGELTFAVGFYCVWMWPQRTTTVQTLARSKHLEARAVAWSVCAVSHTERSQSRREMCSK